MTTNSRVLDVPSRRTFLRGAAGAAGLAVAGGLLVATAKQALALTYQDNWAYCVLCGESVWGGGSFQGGGRCPKQQYDGHAIGSTNYTAVYNQATTGNPGDPNSYGYQNGFHYCTSCTALMWPGKNGPNHCVATSGPHTPGSTSYAMPFGWNNSQFQNGWDLCTSCACVYWGGGWASDGGFCYVNNNDGLARGPAHTHANSVHYQILFT